MRIGISTGAFYGQQETEEAAARLASLAPSCAEVFLQSYSEYSAGFARLVRERLGGVPAVSVHAILHHFECGLYSFSARQREESFAWLTRFLDAAQALDVGVYVYHGPARHRGAGVPPVERWRPGVERVLQMCQARGISLAWETVSWCWLCSLESLRALRKAFPRLRFTLDTKQLFTLGLDPVDFVDALGDSLCHVHILDHDEQGRYALPGAGVHDFAELARALEQNGYRGDIILEPYGLTAQDDTKLRASLDWLRETFRAQ